MRRVQSRGADAEQLLKSIEVDVSEHANRVEVRTTMPMPQQPPRFARIRLRTDYEITLPSGTALELKNMQGNVRLTNVGGDVRVEAMAGDVVGEALSRVRMLRSMSGDVMLSRSVVQGDANLQSVSGNVIASGVKAGSLTMGSVSGNVQVKESSSERALVRTVSGDIEFASVPTQGGALRTQDARRRHLRLHRRGRVRVRGQHRQGRGLERCPDPAGNGRLAPGARQHRRRIGLFRPDHVHRGHQGRQEAVTRPLPDFSQLVLGLAAECPFVCL